MLLRIVKMNFRPEKVNEFIAVFQDRKDFIATSDGCEGVILMCDIGDPNIFFTYSKWKDEKSLEQYRQSELFNQVWDEVKKWFKDKPEAWSLREV